MIKNIIGNPSVRENNKDFLNSIRSFLLYNQLSISRLLIYMILIAVCCLILHNPNWIFDFSLADDYQFVNTTAIGKNSHSWTGNGRFWPLGLCDYCLLLLFKPYGMTVTAHFVYNCITMLLSSIMFFSFLNKVTNNKNYISAFCMLILFAASSFVLIHMSCIYPERQMFLMLSAFLFCYWRATFATNKIAEFVYYFFAILSAAYSTYLKEPVFGLWIIFALSNLIFGKLSLKQKKFNYLLLLNSIIWLSIYVYRCLFIDRSLIDSVSSSHAPYSSGVSSIFDLSIRLFDAEPFMYILLTLAVIRGSLLLFKKAKYDIFADSALFAGVGYAFAYIILNQKGNHYFFPSIVLGIPAFAVLLSKITNNYTKSAIIFFVLITSYFSFNSSLWWIREIIEHRKKDPLIFARLIKEAKEGKQIIYVTEKGKDEPNFDSRDIVSIKFRRYQIFLDYYYGGKFPIIKTTDYSKINKNTVVILSEETYNSVYFKEIEKYLEKSELELSQCFKGLPSMIFRVE